LYPEFASASEWSDQVIDFFISEAACELDPCVWRGKFFAKGSLALAAHLMAVAKKSQTGANGGMTPSPGGIGSLKTGDEQITYMAVNASSDDFGDESLRTTPYGLEFLRLSGQIPGSPIYVC